MKPMRVSTAFGLAVVCLWLAQPVVARAISKMPNEDAGLELALLDGIGISDPNSSTLNLCQAIGPGVRDGALASNGRGSPDFSNQVFWTENGLVPLADCLDCEYRKFTRTVYFTDDTECCASGGSCDGTMYGVHYTASCEAETGSCVVGMSTGVLKGDGATNSDWKVYSCEYEYDCGDCCDSCVCVNQPVCQWLPITAWGQVTCKTCNQCCSGGSPL